MIENVKTVTNPLTIVAIFAALAEIAGTIALKLVSENLQGIFIWFVMLFPVLLVILFFCTLNFNPKVLYAPSDFKDEENFLNTISGVGRLSGMLEEVQKQLDVVKSQILNDVDQIINTVSETERKKLVQIVESRIKLIQDQVSNTRDSANEVVSIASLRNEIQERILNLLQRAGRSMTIREIEDGLIAEYGSSLDSAGVKLFRNLMRLKSQGLVEVSESEKKKPLYYLSASAVRAGR